MWSLSYKRQSDQWGSLLVTGFPDSCGAFLLKRGLQPWPSLPPASPLPPRGLSPSHSGPHLARTAKVFRALPGEVGISAQFLGRCYLGFSPFPWEARGHFSWRRGKAFETSSLLNFDVPLACPHPAGDSGRCQREPTKWAQVLLLPTLLQNPPPPPPLLQELKETEGGGQQALGWRTFMHARTHTHFIS